MPKITKKQIAEALKGSVKKWERIVRKRMSHNEYLFREGSTLSRTPHCPDCLRLAKEELAFLKSLKV